MMTRWIWLFIVLCLFLLVTVSVGVESKRSKKNKSLKNDEGSKDCGRWVYSECVLKNATLGCGRGIKTATRNGTDCKTTKKTVNCTLKCNGHGKCTYGKLVYSECDTTSLTVVGTKTLVKGDASCKQTISIIKKCRKNKRNEKKNKKGRQHPATKPDRHAKKSRGKQPTKEE